MAAAVEGGSRRDTGHFSLLQKRPVILHASDWEISDPTAALWSVLEALPVTRSYLLVSPTWTLEESATRHRLSSAIQTVRDRFDHVEVVVLASSPAEFEAWAGRGETGLYCSQNAFVREDHFFPIPDREPTFDAIYDAKWADYKRHQLAGSIRSLALIAYPLPQSSSATYSQKALTAVGHATWFTTPWLRDPPYLSASEVNAAYSTARVGLCLSEAEGACFASIQYLLSGLPVVTTKNLGGRDEFLNERVARWVEADADAIAAAVAELAARHLDPTLIRTEALDTVSEHRQRLLEWIRRVVEEADGRPSRWHVGWPPGLPDKLMEPQASVDEVIGFISGSTSAAVGAPIVRRVTLTDEERARFHDQGYLVVDRPLVTSDEIEEVRRLLDALFDRFDELPRRFAYDLGDVKVHDGPQQVPEINFVLDLDPRLAETAAFASCRDLAHQLLSNRAFCNYDHAIYKPPDNKPSANNTTVGWHQDLAYAPELESSDEVHLWLALQDVTEAHGCMQFAPGSNRLGLLPHRPRGHSPQAHALVTDCVDPTTAVTCPLGAGMAVVHQPGTLHTTGPNRTDEVRASWILHFVDNGP